MPPLYQLLSKSLALLRASEDLDPEVLEVLADKLSAAAMGQITYPSWRYERLIAFINRYIAVHSPETRRRMLEVESVIGPAWTTGQLPGAAFGLPRRPTGLERLRTPYRIEWAPPIGQEPFPAVKPARVPPPEWFQAPMMAYVGHEEPEYATSGCCAPCDDGQACEIER